MTVPPKPAGPTLPPGWVNNGGQAVTPGGLVYRQLLRGVQTPGAYQVKIPVTLTGPKGSWSGDVTLDTGDFELMISPAVAAQLGLPQDQSFTVEGVTGSEAAYFSACGVTLGEESWQGVNCFVAQSQADMLVGLRMFINRQIGFRFDPTTMTVELYVTP